jgi:hypothetical protein
MGRRIAGVGSFLVGLLALPLVLVLSFCWSWIERFLGRGAVMAAILYGAVVYALIVLVGVQAIRCMALAPALWRGRDVHERAASIRRYAAVATASIGVIGILLPFVVHFPGREWMILEYWVLVIAPALVVGTAVTVLAAGLASPPKKNSTAPR